MVRNHANRSFGPKIGHFYRHNFFDFKKLKSHHYGLPRVECKIRFQREPRFQDLDIFLSIFKNFTLESEKFSTHMPNNARFRSMGRG